LCTRPPDVPCKEMVEVAGCALCAAVKVIVCATPGMSVTEEGEAATPCGRPLRARLTFPVKLLKASAEILSDVDEPAVRARLACGTSRVKSARLVDVITVCEIEPDIPVTAKPIGAAVTFAAAVRITLCEDAEGVAGMSVNVAGDTVTPAGKPENEKLTGFEKPFVPVTEMETDCCEFGATVTEAGIDIEKSG